MAIIKNVSSTGGKTSSSLSGDIFIDDASNKLVVRSPSTHQVLLEIDNSGLTLYGTNGAKLVQLDNAGLHLYRTDGTVELMSLSRIGMVYSETSGIRRILLGAHPVDGHIIEAISKIGTDVINLLGGS